MHIPTAHAHFPLFSYAATPRSVEVNRSVATPADDPFAERFDDDAGFFEPMDLDAEKMRSAPTGDGAQEVRHRLDSELAVLSLAFLADFSSCP